MPPYKVTYPVMRDDDRRIRVEIQPPKLPWPVAYYFTQVTDDEGQLSFVLEGAEYGAAVPLEEHGVDAEPAMRAADHYRQHANDYERMAMHLCRPTPENRRRAAEIYAARILGLRRLRRTEAARLRIRDEYRAYVVREGRRHGAIQAVAFDLHMNRKAVRRALEDCVRRGEIDAFEIPAARRRRPAPNR
jgi:hypothetical protein